MMKIEVHDWSDVENRPEKTVHVRTTWEAGGDNQTNPRAFISHASMLGWLANEQFIENIETVTITYHTSDETFDSDNPFVLPYVPSTLAVQCVSDIIKDLTDRKGLKQEYAEMDNDVRWDIRLAWQKFIDDRIVAEKENGERWQKRLDEETEYLEKKADHGKE